MPASLLPPQPFISPAMPVVIPAGTVQFSASFGSGSGYTWALDTNASGGNINTGSGLYTSGASFNTVDTISVTDSNGNTSTRDIRVLDQNQTATLASIRNTCKTRLDLVNSLFITDAEWNGYINSSAYALYNKIVSAYGNDYNVADPFYFTTDGLQERYPLPPDFFKHLTTWVKFDLGPNGWLRVPQFNRGEATRYMLPYQVFYGVRTNLHYRIEGNNVWFLPLPSAGQNVRIAYVPRMYKMINDNDVLDGVSGWEEYVVLDVCIKGATKREQDASNFGTMLSVMDKQIDDIAENRDAGSASTVVDVRGQDEGSGNGGGGMW